MILNAGYMSYDCNSNDDWFKGWYLIVQSNSFCHSFLRMIQTKLRSKLDNQSLYGHSTFKPQLQHTFINRSVCIECDYSGGNDDNLLADFIAFNLWNFIHVHKWYTYIFTIFLICWTHYNDAAKFNFQWLWKLLENIFKNNFYVTYDEFHNL